MSPFFNIFPGRFFVGFVLLGTSVASAELVRIGNLSLSPVLNFGAHYSDNVDQVSDDIPSTVDKEDFWINYGVSLSASAAYFPAINVSATSSLSWEKHFSREDLDDDSDPAVNAIIDTSGQMGRYSYTLRYARQGELTADREDQVVPGGRTESRRDLTSTDSAGATVSWSYNTVLDVDTAYTLSRERHSEGFTAGDTDEQAARFGVSLKLWPRVTMRYNRTWEKNEFPEQVAADQNFDWEETETANVAVSILKKPAFTFTVGFEKEDDGDKGGEWEPVYTWTLSDTLKLAPNLTLSGSTSYSLEEDEEEDDISFTYNGTLTHVLPGGWNQSLAFSREPAETFGSSVESDSTTWSYSLSQGSFFFRNLAMTLSVVRDIDRPPESAPKEVTDTVTFGLRKSLPPLIRGVSHSCGYTFIYEDSNLSGGYTENEVTYTASLPL